MSKRGYCGIGLDNPKDSVNVGSALRAAGCYGAAFVAASGKRFGVGPTDTMKTYRHLPLLRPDDIMSLLPFDCVPVAVDLVEGATPLQDYKHPERAYYIFGAEDATLGDRILSRCRDIIYVPTKGCMNLAATVNVILYDRMAKEGRSMDDTARTNMIDCFNGDAPMPAPNDMVGSIGSLNAAMLAAKAKGG